jgi:hypothetical protein
MAISSNAALEVGASPVAKGRNAGSHRTSVSLPEWKK